MFCFSVLAYEDNYDKLYVNVSGFYYKDIKDSMTFFLTLDGLDYERYASMDGMDLIKPLYVLTQ